MASQVSLTAQLIGGPSPVCGDGSFPSGISNIPFGLNPPNGKSYVVTTGVQEANINSPGSFVVLGGIGTTVGNAHTLYLRTVQPILIEISQNGLSTYTVSVNGLFFLEPATGNEVQTVQVKGVAAIEYYAAGNS